MSIGKHSIFLSVTLSVATAMVLLLVFYHQITDPSSRWEDALSPEKLTEQFGNIKAIKRSDVWAYLGRPDEENMPKEYDNWLDRRMIRKIFKVVYSTGVNEPEQNPITSFIYYECSIVVLDRNITLNSAYLDLDKQ
ncbi:hypothetical protein [Mesorhizobium sp. LjNodule214]|uniref:hypothetical protein n=1 Tax=Mesorhizobium sp. LjNodule214 TaxID=3342252 RepID=UPI003ECE280F